MHVDSNMIGEKMKSLYDNLTQKAGREYKVGEFNPSKGLGPYKKLLEKFIRQTEIAMYFYKICPVSLPLCSPLSPSSLLPLPTLNQQNQPFLLLLLIILNMKMKRMKTFMMIHFYLM